jgi:metal-responsive CopG/Arc/MetJ family transcriptional regulator
MPLQLQLRLNKYALKKGVSRNEIMREAITAYLKVQKKNNKQK